MRREQPDAGGLVIATDQEHARGIAALLQARFGTRRASSPPTTRTPPPGSPPSPSGTEPWLVAVRMVSEGVDIPRLRVGVYATTTATELFFRQAVGRLVRWTRGVPRQRAWLFIPDDPRLRILAARIAEQRRHSLRRDGRDAPFDRADDEADVDALPGDEEQMSLFAVISAVATGADGARRRPVPVRRRRRPRRGRRGRRLRADASRRRRRCSGDGAPGRRARPCSPARRRSTHLRDANAAIARELARRTGLTHGQVNAELNRLSGVRRVAEATIDQLERRLRAGEKWLAKT